MPRTLPAALTTVMDTGIYTPYIRVIHMPFVDGTEYSIQPIKFKLPPTADEPTTVTFAPENFDASNYGYFRIVRGAMINGTPSTISSMCFITTKVEYDGKFVTLTGKALPDTRATFTANLTYEGVINKMLGVPGVIEYEIARTYEGTATWKSYQFYPDSRQPIFSPLNSIFRILKQKYLIYAVENNYAGNVGEAGEIFFFVATDTRTLDYTITDILFHRKDEQQNRQLLWRDENATIHTNGSSSSKIHNLGYLESTDSAPPNTSCTNIGSKSTRIKVNLKYRTGDYIQITGRNTFNDFTGRVKVTETFDADAEPAWYMELEKLDWFSTTEGGAMPSTIEASAPYTPLVTGSFSNVLSSNDNNLQAAMETIDDHDHGGLATTEGIQDIVGAMVSSNTETGIAVTYDDTNGKLDFVAEVTQAELDAHLNDTSDVHAYTSLSAKPAAETNTNFIFGCTSPGGTSAFAGTIATLPGGATLTYNVSSGTEGAMVPSATTHLAKMRLYNTTRGTSALISNCVTGTNTLTLTANVPGGWQVGDTITIASQTVTGAPVSYVDLEITSGPTNKLYLFVTILIISATAGDNARLHPTETYASSKQKTAQCPVANLNGVLGSVPVKITSNVISLAWTGTPTNIFVIEDGYLE